MSQDWDDLSKWQATSAPELGDRKPQELFGREFCEKYTRLHHLIWDRIVRLHGTLLSLETLDGFPFDYIYPRDEMTFWHLVFQNFRDIFFIGVNSLINDHGSDAHGLRSFKNLIIKAQWIDDGLQQTFCRSLTVFQFDQRIESISKRIEAIRNHRIAHQLIDRDQGLLLGVMEGVSLHDMRAVFEVTHCLFGRLSFGATYVTLPFELAQSYAQTQHRDSCLESVLTAVAKESYIVNQPERRSQYWPIEKDFIDPKEREVMNALRQRVGLGSA